MRKAAQQTPDGFPKGETLHRMCKGRIILFWLSVRGKPCVLRSADHAVPVPTLHYKTHSRHALPISGQLDIFAAGSFCVAGNRQQLRCIPVSYTSNKQRHPCGWLLPLSTYQPSPATDVMHCDAELKFALFRLHNCIDDYVNDIREELLENGINP